MRPSRQEISEQMALMEKYAEMKLATGDWHGLSDAANDLRELEAKLQMIELEMLEHNSET